ncbi:MAG: domain S-box [Bacillota bacterium]|nr:domain S-box [Bacillota bacterium]
MDAVEYKNFTEGFTVEQMMNRNFKVLHPEDSLRKVIEYYQQFKVNTLPVVNEAEKLVGVFPKKRLYKALLEGADLETPCGTYMVEHPIFITVDRTYDEYSLVVRVTKSKVDNVVVLDRSGRVAGMIGTGEYLRGSLSVIMASSALMESLFRVNYEGIIITNQTGILLRINPAAAKLFGLDAELVKGKALQSLLTEIEISEERRIGQKMILNGIPVIVSQVPILENGEKIGFSFAFLDVSDMEKIARELELVKELQHTVDGVLSASSDGVFVSDPEGIVRYVNERACSLLTCKAEDIIGKPIRELLWFDKNHSSGSVPSIKCVETERKDRLGKSSTGAGVDVCNVQGKHCIVSHIPFLRDGRQSIVSTVYLNDNAVTEEIARKWLYLNQQVQYYRDQLEKRGEGGRFQQMVTHNPAFTKIKNEAQLIARSSSTVLLTGESGVGKDMFARGIHEASPRAKQPFIKVSCVSIPETLFESELFGYAPGSFTGALKNGKPGYFERAHKGTVFLDEIGDMPMSIQAKLLQVLQEKEFTRVGGAGKQSVDVRIIAATNRDLR